TTLLAQVDLVRRFPEPLPDSLRVIDLARAHDENANANANTSDVDAFKPVTADAPALIMFTSGTTSKKKAVVLSHRNLSQATRNITAFMGIDSQIREYVSIPLSHSFGLGRARAVFAVGGTLVMSDRLLNAATMVKAIELHDCNALSAVPASLSIFSGKQ